MQSVAIPPSLLMEQLPCPIQLEVWKWSTLVLQAELQREPNLQSAWGAEAGVPLPQPAPVSLSAILTFLAQTIP